MPQYLIDSFHSNQNNNLTNRRTLFPPSDDINISRSHSAVELINKVTRHLTNTDNHIQPYLLLSIGTGLSCPIMDSPPNRLCKALDRDEPPSIGIMCSMQWSTSVRPISPIFLKPVQYHSSRPIIHHPIRIQYFWPRKRLTSSEIKYFRIIPDIHSTKAYQHYSQIRICPRANQIMRIMEI